MNNMKEVQNDDVIHPDVIKMDNAIKDAYEVMAEIYYKEGYIESVQDIIDSIYVKTPANVPQGYTVSLGNKEMLEYHKTLSEQILIDSYSGIDIKEFRIWWNDCCNI